MPSQIPMPGLEQSVDWFFVLLAVCALALVVLLIARALLRPNHDPEALLMSEENLRRRKQLWQNLLWLVGIAVLVTALMCFHSVVE